MTLCRAMSSMLGCLALVTSACNRGRQPEPQLLLRFEKAACGYADPSGKFAIKPHFEMCREFREGFAAVKIGGKWGFIDPLGKLVVDPVFDEVSDFSDGVARFGKEDRQSALPGVWRYGYVNPAGEIAIEPKLHLWPPGDFGEGLAGVAADREMKFGFMDKTGKITIPTRFSWVGKFSEGLAPAAVSEDLSSDRKWGAVDSKGKFVITPQFVELSEFSDGLAVACISSDNSEKKCGYVKKDGDWQIPPRFSAAMPFSEGMAAIEMGKKWGYVNMAGEIAIQPAYDSVASFSGGTAAVFSDGKGKLIAWEVSNLINRSGRTLFFGSGANHATRQVGGVTCFFAGLEHSATCVNANGQVAWQFGPNPPLAQNPTEKQQSSPSKSEGASSSGGQAPGDSVRATPAARPITLARKQVIRMSSGLAVGRGKVFWTHMGAGGGGRGPGAVRCTDASGGSLTTVIGGLSSPGPLAIDDKFAYWGDDVTRPQLFRAPLSGGSPHVLANGDVVAVTTDGDFVYWADRKGGIRKVKKTGGKVITLATEAFEVDSIAVGNGMVYWGARDLDQRKITDVRTVAVDGGKPSSVATEGFQFLVNVAVDNGSIFWSAPGSSNVVIKAFTRGALQPRVIATTTHYSVAGLVAHGGFVYWIEDHSAIKRASIESGQSETLADGLRGAFRVVVDDTGVYWISQGPADIDDGTVSRLPFLNGGRRGSTK